MTEEEIFNKLCDVIDELDNLSGEFYAQEYFGMGIELDWISQRARDALKNWQKEIVK